MLLSKRAVHLRFIPACAGNVSVAASPKGSCPVHPRVRGEYSRYRNPPRYVNGSSPVRGEYTSFK